MGKWFLGLLAGVLLTVGIVSAQEIIGSTPSTRHTHAIDQLDDMMSDVEDSLMTCRFYDALTGAPIEGGNVDIESSGVYQTDWEGKVRFPYIEDGNYRMTFSRSGYITTNIKLRVMAEVIFFNRFSISPTMPLGNLRVVVDWEQTPPDVDAHLVKQGAYHISFTNMHVYQDGIARLDRDDLDGYGPETITTTEVDPNATYEYFLHDYTDRNDPNTMNLSRSKANVKVYGSDRLMNVFDVPMNQQGNYWHVFSIRNGQVVPVNRMMGSSPVQ